MAEKQDPSSVEVVELDEETRQQRQKLVEDKASSPPRPEWHGAAVFVLGFALLVVSLAASGALAHGPLPPALSRDAPPAQFSGTRAHDALATVVGVGVRHSSSRAILVAQDLVVAMLQNFSSTAAARGNGVEIEWTRDSKQRVVVGFGGIGCCAVDVPQLVIRVSDGTNETKRSAIIVDAHLDSQFFSPGASDNGAAVATSLEILRAIANMDSYPFARALIFSLSCEEEGLEGAMQFMEAHPWRESVVAFVDLESGGRANSAEFLVRSTGDDINALYARSVPHPLGYSIIQDLFAVGGGDTHYTVYSFLGLPGADLVFTYGAPSYHNPTDDLENVSPEALQNEGDNLLALLGEMVKADFTSPRVNRTGGFVSTHGAFSLISFAGEQVLFSIFAVALIALIVLLAWKHLLRLLGMFGLVFAAFVSGILLSFVVALVACSVHPLAFYNNVSLFVALVSVTAILGAMLPMLAAPRLLKNVSVQPDSFLQLRWLGLAATLVLLALLYILTRAIGFGFSFTILLCLCLDTVALAVGFVCHKFFSRVGSITWFVISGVLPTVIIALSVLLWTAPNFFVVGSLYLGSLGWGGGATTGAVAALLISVFLIGLALPLVVFAQLSFKPLTDIEPEWKKRLFAKPSIPSNIVLAILVVALAVAVMVVSPFSAVAPCRLFITHRTNTTTNDTRIVIALADVSETDLLKKDLESAGIASYHCSTVEFAAKIGRGTGLCINASHQDPNLVLPEISTTTTSHENGNTTVVLNFVTRGNSTSRIVVFPPQDATSVCALERIVPKWTHPYPVSIALGPDNDGTALSVSFQIPTAQIGTTKVAMRAESVEYTPEFAAVYNKLPMWIGPSGKVNTPAPSSIFHSINV